MDNTNELQKLESYIAPNKICIADYTLNEYTFSTGAISEINKAFERLESELAALKEAQRWRNAITEPPKDNSDILLKTEGESMLIGCYLVDEKRYWSSAGWRNIKYLAWHPLPAPEEGEV